jgi:beta-glucosidase
VTLQPGQSRMVTITAEPRTLAEWDEHAHAFHIRAGSYRVEAGQDAGVAGNAANTDLNEQVISE